MRQKVNLLEKHFGRLTVIKELEPISYKRMFQCKCECGNTTINSYSQLISGHTRSCGCLRKEYYLSRKKEPSERKKNRRPRLYRCWSLMKRRTKADNKEKAERYYQRGISVCKEWNLYDDFEKWALANGYNDTLTLDRINNDKGYFPDNCRWVSYLIQENNRSNNVRITYNNETHTLAEWSKILGIKRDTLNSRFRYGWTIEEAFTRPVQKRA